MEMNAGLKITDYLFIIKFMTTKFKLLSTEIFKDKYEGIRFSTNYTESSGLKSN